MGHMSLETYEAVIGLLVEAGKVRRRSNHLLEWIGPGGSAIERQTNTNRKETTK
jgi:hypothetical protein